MISPLFGGFFLHAVASLDEKQDYSVFAKIGRGFKNLFDGDSDKKH